MSLPHLAPIPPANVRLSLESAEWEACLDAWLTLAQYHFRASSKHLSTELSLQHFLHSYYHELAHLDPKDNTLRSSKAQSLQRVSFALARRSLLETVSLQDLASLDFLSDVCRAHIKSQRLPELLSSLWQAKSAELQALLQKRKIVLTAMLDSGSPDVAEATLSRLGPMLRASPDVAVFLLTGSDFLDSLVSGFAKAAAEITRKAITMTVYLGLLACGSGETSNASMLSDHLYSLKSQAEGKPPAQSLLADLVTNTPLLGKLHKNSTGKTPERLVKLYESLETFRSPSIARTSRRPRRKTKKSTPQTGHHDEFHVHRMSLVTQIQDLFPDLGAGFVMKLLDEYDDNVEEATAHLLDDSLPEYLQTLDRTETAPVADGSMQEGIENLAPRSTPPLPASFVPDRRNVYDDDEFDRLQLDTSRLHIGKRNEVEQSHQPNKSAILSALAAFDSDDDERDDTYDVEDVGGTIDAAHPDGEPGPTAKVTQEENDMALFTTYKSSPELFGRTFDVRRGQARAALKAETGLTDEAIEGWAIMLQRDPRRLRKLEAQLGSFDGRQSELKSTAYRESPAGTETEDSDVPTNRGGFRGGRGRSAGGGRGRGRGGSVAGPSGDADTVAAQRRKEASKSSRANHNRRNQRAKKMARGGFAG